MSKPSKKGEYGRTEGASTSKGRATPKVNKDDEDLARKLNEELNAGYLEDEPSTDQGQPTTGNPKEIREAIDFVQGYADDVLNTCCHACERRLIRNVEVKDWIRKWKDVGSSRSSPSASGCTCECGATTCLGCGLEVRVGDARYMAEYDELKLDYCCSKGGVFVAMIVLCRYDYMELALQERSRQNEATANKDKQILGRYYANNGLPGTGTGYDAHTRNPFLAVRTPGLQQALNFRQVDAETDRATMQILGILIELLPKRGETTRKVSPVMSSMIELSLLQDRVAELLRNDSLQDVNNRAALYFAAFELVTRLGHHSMLDYLVREDRFKKKQSAGLHAIAIAGHTNKGKGKGKGKSDEQEVLVVATRSEGPLAPSLLSCMNNLATQSKVLLGASNRTAAGKDIVEVSKRIKNVYKGLIGEEKATVATITTWKEYHRANCLTRKPNVARHLCATMATVASQVYNPDKGRMGRLITEATEMTTSLPEGIFVLVDEVRPDIMKVHSLPFRNLSTPPTIPLTPAPLGTHSRPKRHPLRRRPLRIRHRLRPALPRRAPLRLVPHHRPRLRRLQPEPLPHRQGLPIPHRHLGRIRRIPLAARQVHHHVCAGVHPVHDPLAVAL